MVEGKKEKEKDGKDGQSAKMQNTLQPKVVGMTCNEGYPAFHLITNRDHANKIHERSHHMIRLRQQF